MASADTKRNAPWYVKAFVIVHVFCIVSWTIPTPRSDLLTGRVEPPVTAVGDWVRLLNIRYVKSSYFVQDYVLTSGTWQYWDMFAPNPAQSDWWGDAEVVYKDGSKRPFAYPRMFSLPLHNKYAQERYRKFFEKVQTTEGGACLWQSFGLHVAHVCDNPNNPPVTVRIFKHHLQIARPGEPQAQQYTSDLVYEYAVDQRELARMRKMWP